jgi:transcriptional regulator with XRE-family HTH domain
VDRNRTQADTSILAVFGRNLTAARVSAGLTQQELAARAGIAATTLAQIEGGCSDPDLRLLGTLAYAVGCDAYDLVNLVRERRQF